MPRKNIRTDDRLLTATRSSTQWGKKINCLESRHDAYMGLPADTKRHREQCETVTEWMTECWQVCVR